MQFCREVLSQQGSWDDCASNPHQVVLANYSPAAQRDATSLGCEESWIGVASQEEGFAWRGV